MAQEKMIDDPEMIAAYVKTAREIYRFDDGLDAIEIDDPPVVIACVGGARVRGWAPTEATLDVCALEFAEPRTVRTTPTGIVARVWLPVDEEDLIG
jgi:hypothetical protein